MPDPNLDDLTFDELIAPLPAAQFINEIFDRVWLHIDAKDRNRFEQLISWPALNGLLNLRVWSDRTMTMVLDKEPLPAAAFCSSTGDRNHQTVMQPNPGQVMEWCQRGASLVLNEIESLHPPIRHIANILNAAMGARVSANLYCSWSARQAFDAHYDRHDVFALQVIGKKRWRVYQGRIEQPIEHAMFQNNPQSEYDRQKGTMDREVLMAPGDLLYLPRGQFHEALAEDGPSIHLTFSCNAPTGMDWLNFLWERAVQDPEFRKNLPLAQSSDGPPNGSANGARDGKAQAGGDAMSRHLAALGTRFSALAQDPNLLAQLRQMRRHFGADLPPYGIMSEGLSEGLSVTGKPEGKK